MNHRFADVIAGCSVAGLMLPEAVAYAAIAGFAPQHAIFAAIAGGLTYALFGRSRFAIVAPTSSSAAMLAAAVGGIGVVAVPREVLAMLIVGLAAAIFLIAGFLRLGSLSGFIARPVLRGFAFGLALTIIIKQLPIWFGLQIHAPDVAQLVLAVLCSISAINLISLSIGSVALAVLLFLRRFSALPGAIMVLLGGVAVSYFVDLPALHVAQVGTISATMTLPTLPHVSFATWSQIAQLALPLALIIFAESWGTMRTLSLAHGDSVDADTELRALGLANLAAALIQGMPVGAGFSASSANAGAGATSRRAAMIAALGLGALLLFAGQWVARIPEPVLAAIVISALTHALSLAPLQRLWTLDRDQWIALTAASAVIFLGVLNGMLVAVGLSLFALIRRLATPRISQLGQLDGGHDFVDIAAHPTAVVPNETLIFRPNAPLFFANAERCFAEILSLAIKSKPKYVIISLEESDDFDSSSLESLLECAESLANQRIILTLARVHDRVRDLLITADEPELARSACFSVADSVARIRGEQNEKHNRTLA